MARTKPTGSPPSKEPHRKAAMDTDKQRPATESAVSRTSLSASVQSQAYAPSGWQCQPPRQQHQPPAQQGPPPGGQHHDYARGSYYYSRSRADERRDTREPCRSNEPRYRHERAGGNEGYNRRDREYNNSSFAGGGKKREYMPGRDDRHDGRSWKKSDRKVRPNEWGGGDRGGGRDCQPREDRDGSYYRGIRGDYRNGESNVKHQSYASGQGDCRDTPSYAQREQPRSAQRQEQATTTHDQPPLSQEQVTTQPAPLPPRPQELLENDRLRQQLEKEKLAAEIEELRLKRERDEKDRLAVQLEKERLKQKLDQTKNMASETINYPVLNQTIGAKKKARRRRETGRAKLSPKLKNELRAAQESNDEQRKHELLKEYENTLAKKRANNAHVYTERDLMKAYTPEIIDHSVVGKKFLVHWSKSSEKKTRGRKGKPNEVRCTSWISQEDFTFPLLAQTYLGQKIKDGKYKHEVEELKSWSDECKEQQLITEAINSFDEIDEEFDTMLEVDFCCFLCKCPWENKLKRTVRNCEHGLKYHRGCCHGYADKEEFESFVSPVGKVQQQMLELLEQIGEGKEEEQDSDDQSDSSNNDARDKKETEQCSVEISPNCDPKTYHQCKEERSGFLHGRKGRMHSANVLSINSGIGSACLALKQLGVSMKKVVHVVDDRVSQHVFRSNHEKGYFGGKDNDDGIEHITNLYNTLGDLAVDQKGLVEKFGPIDVVVCSCPMKTEEETEQFIDSFLDLVKQVERYNKELHNFEFLFYLLEVPEFIDVEDYLSDVSYCKCERLNDTDRNERTFICNWPLEKEVSNLQSLGSSLSRRDGSTDNLLGFPSEYMKPGKSSRPNFVEECIILHASHFQLLMTAHTALSLLKTMQSPIYTKC